MRKPSLPLVLSIAVLAAIPAPAQTANDGIVLGARGVGPTVPLKIYNPAGSVRVMAWDRDSIVVRGPSRPTGFFFGGSPMALKFGVNEFMFGVEEPRGDTAKAAHLVVWVPRHSQVAVKTASASIERLSRT